MNNAEIYKLVELLGPVAKDNPKVKGLLAALDLNPKMADIVIKLLRGMLRQAGIDPNDPAALPLVTQLPQGGAQVGTVINGMQDGPIFHVAEGSASDLENVGLFGLPRWGKTYILIQTALYTMLNGNVCWMFDVEDELSRLVDAIPEPYKPLTGDALKVFIRIAEVAETAAERCDGLQMDRICEVIVRAVLTAKGYIVQENQILAPKFKFYQLTSKGVEWANSQGIKVMHFELSPVHEYLLEQAEKNIGLLNSQFKFQRNSEIAREHDIQPDLLLIQPMNYRTIIEVVFTLCAGR